MRNRRLVAAVLVLALLVPVPVNAEPAARREVAVALDVDVSTLPEDRFTKVLQANVVEHQTATLGRAGIAVREGEGEVLRIEIRRYGPDEIHYRATLAIVGDEGEGATREITCEACTDAQLLAKVDAETAVLAERLVRADAAVVVEPEPDPEREVAVEEPEVEPRGPTEPEAVDHEEQRIGAAGYAGIASLTLGLGLGIGGVILAVAKPELRPHPTDDQSFEQVSRRPLGYGLTAAGASLLAAGVVLVAIDQTVLRKRRARRAAVAVIVPTFSSTGAGLALVRRF